MNEYGDFEEVVQESNPNSEQPQEEMIVRVRQPRQGQLLGIVTQRLGGNRMMIKTKDQKLINCRVPGRFKRKFWLRVGNFVLIELWPDDAAKGDVVYQYSKGEQYQLKKRGMVNELRDEF